MFKDAYRQEAIVDKVRAIEFDMESAGTAEVGSLLGSVSDAPNGFERIADDDDEQAPVEMPKAKSARGSRGSRNKQKSAGQNKEAEIADQPEASETDEAKSQKKNSGKSGEAGEGEDGETVSKASAPARKKKNRGGKKTAKQESREDAEASVKESSNGGTAEMAVRRGGRNRRRPGEQERGAKPETDERPAARNERPAARDEKPIARGENGESDAPVESSRPSGYRGGDRNDGIRNDNSRGGRERGGSNGGGRRDQRGSQPTITGFAARRSGNSRQIAKEPIAKKGARITSHIALPGRFLGLYADD
jgi:ribonuclease G